MVARKGREKIVGKSALLLINFLMTSFYSFVPKKSNKLLACWVNELNINIKISNPRKTKLGDFKVRGDNMTIS